MRKLFHVLCASLGLFASEAQATVTYLCEDGTIITLRFTGSEAAQRAKLEAAHPCVQAYHRAEQERLQASKATSVARKRPGFAPEGR